MAEARTEGGAGTQENGRYGALYIDLETNIRKVLKAFVVNHARPAEAHLAVPAALSVLLVNFIASFGRDEMTVRAGCVDLIDVVIAANRDEIAELIRARRAHQGGGTA